MTTCRAKGFAFGYRFEPTVKVILATTRRSPRAWRPRHGKSAFGPTASGATDVAPGSFSARCLPCGVRAVYSITSCFANLEDYGSATKTGI
jgi:hypothetical protein